MEPQKQSAAALDAWLGPETWHTGHPTEMKHFHRFVSMYQHEHGFEIDESSLREEILRRIEVFHPAGRKSELRKDRVNTLMSLAVEVLEFLKATGR